MKYDKGYFERYALLSLIKCFDYKLEDLLDSNFESPDWQSDILDLGIEVTRAESPSDGKLSFIINKFFNKGLSGKEIKDAIQREHGEYSNFFGEIDNSAYCSVSYSFSNEINKIIKAITTKIEKLNKPYFEVFKQNWLYVFADVGLHKDDILSIKDSISNCVNKKQFDKIFINITDKIIIINKNGLISEVVVDNKTLKQLKIDATTKENRR